MRYLPDVIDRVIALIPDNTDGIYELNKIKESAKYAAPELQSMWWGAAQDVLVEYVPATEEILKVWNDTDAC